MKPYPETKDMAKITAHFGADVSDIEAKMTAATRATKAYEKAVKGLDSGKKLSLDQELTQGNEKLGKAMNLLKGGAIGAGVSMLVGKMKQFSEAAEQMGDKATAAQKSAALWGKEMKDFSTTLEGWGVSALGVFAKVGRAWGGMVRTAVSPEGAAAEDRAAAIAEASGKAADAIEAKTAKMKEAAKKDAAEIPALEKKKADAQREVWLSSLSEYGRILTEQSEMERKLEEANSGPKTAKNQKAKLEAETALILLKGKRAELEKKMREEEAREEQANAQKAQESANKAIEEKKAKAAEYAQKEKNATEEIAQIRYDKAWEGASNEQRLSQTVKEGRKAMADYEKEKSEQNLLRVEKLRKKYDEVKKAIEDAAKATEGIAPEDKFKAAGFERGEDGKLRRGRVIVSDEDAAAALATKARDAGFTARAKAQEIRAAGRIGEKPSLMNKTESLLSSIDKKLDPVKL